SLRIPHALNDLLLLAADRFPALEPRYRAPFLDPDHVTHVIFGGRIVGVTLLGPAHRLLHHRMGVAALDAHDDRLVLLVAYDRALEHALGHRKSSYFAFSVRRFCAETVLIRAMSRRT